MTIGDLLEALHHPTLLPELPVVNARVSGTAATGVVYDSRRASAGSVFVALRGQHSDGAEFAPQAASRGAAVIIAESPRPVAVQTPWIVVPDARLGLAYLADRFYGQPSRDLRVVGITGTNGKTTTAFLVRAICEAAGLPCGLMGTVMYSTGGEDKPATRTTPEAPDVQQMLREMADRSCAAAVMEVSSHALVLKRVHGIRFAAGVFTNLTRDHLDFHGDMETYAAAKAQLFELLPDDAPGILNLDDPKAVPIGRGAVRKVTYAVKSAADVTPENLTLTLNGLQFDLRTPRGRLRLRSPLIGRPNVYNVLAAAATGFALDLPDEAIQRGVSALSGVPGRFETVSTSEDDTVVVIDYAHTDDALRNLLETARSLAAGRLITVFGCGGDRDRTKRPLMGAVAGRLSDVVIVTSDNPRSEDPQRIIDEILRGMPAPSERVLQTATGPRTSHGPDVHTVVDRKTAINRAVELARAGDVVMVAGKGHEKYQEIGDRVFKFDDVEVARDALARRRTRLHVV